MSIFTLHGANRVLERGITVEAILRISDQEENLKRVRELTAPIANGKALKIRYRGQQYVVTTSGITTKLSVRDTMFVIGIDEQHPRPTIVTAWSSTSN